MKNIDNYIIMLKEILDNERSQLLTDNIGLIEDTQFSKMLELFPIHVDNYNIRSNNHYKEYNKIVEGTINRTLKPLTLLSKYPSRLDFFGVADINGTMYVLSYKEAIDYVLSSEAGSEMRMEVINPNLNRVAKLIYGNSIENVNDELNDWFASHIMDTHTNLYRKNIGEEYNTDKLTDEELAASGNWLDEDFHSEIGVAFSVFEEIRYSSNAKYAKPKLIVNILRMMNVIQAVEITKSEMIGYGFTDESNIEIQPVDMPIIEYLVNRFGDSENSEIIQEIKALMPLDEATFTILLLMANSCLSEDMKYILKGAIVEMYNVCGLNSASNEYPVFLMSKVIASRGCSKVELENEYARLKSTVEPLKVTRTELSKYLRHYYTAEGLLIIDNNDHTYSVYDGRDRSMTAYAKAVCTKFELDVEEVLNYKNKLKQVTCSEELKGEASVIQVAIDKQIKLPILEKLPKDYISMFEGSPLSVNKNVKTYA